MVLSAPAQPLLVLSEERTQRELRQAEEREIAERQRVRTLYLPLLIFAVWQVIGAGIMLLSARTSDAALGAALFAGSFGVGYSGAFFHLIVYYVRGRERGDW